MASIQTTPMAQRGCGKVSGLMRKILPISFVLGILFLCAYGLGHFTYRTSKYLECIGDLLVAPPLVVGGRLSHKSEMSGPPRIIWGGTGGNLVMLLGLLFFAGFVAALYDLIST
jgi:hypothetical protein